MITVETKHDAYMSLNKEQRYEQIQEILKELKEATAKEIAVVMWKKGYIPTSERNFSAPRLTELCKTGVVQVIEKKVCNYTGKKVAVYALVKNE